MIYKYKAVSQNGEIIEGVFEGSDESDVITMLKGNKYLAMSIEKDLGAEAQVDLFAKKVKKKDLAVFCRQFYTMLDAGIGIVKCLEILEKQSENKNLVKAISGVHEDVQKGFTLSEGMKKHRKVFPQLLINVKVKDKKAVGEDALVNELIAKLEKELGKDGRILVRESGTEPVIRVMAEAKTDELCKKTVNEIIEKIKEQGHIINED